MKTIELSKARGPLSEYARDAQRETLIVMSGGKPLAALTSVEGVDLETLALSNSPNLDAILEKSRKSIRDNGGLSTAEVRRMFGLSEPKKKTSKRLTKRKSARAGRTTKQ